MLAALQSDTPQRGELILGFVHSDSLFSTPKEPSSPPQGRRTTAFSLDLDQAGNPANTPTHPFATDPVSMIHRAY
jgi:hypothetical protein